LRRLHANRDALRLAGLSDYGGRSDGRERGGAPVSDMSSFFLLAARGEFRLGVNSCARQPTNGGRMTYYGPKNLADSYRTVRRNTLTIAEEIPADKYAFRAAPDVIAPGKRPRVTLTPTLALKDGQPWMAFSVQGGDSQDQNLLQYFLNVLEFGMTPQQAAEAPNINSFQMMNSFDDHSSRPGRMLVASSIKQELRQQLESAGYTLEFAERTSGPITAIWFDRKHATRWGAVSNHGEDYGIAW
jgi:hypothetical protein